MSENRYNVLFLCTGNSVRSIMAECILNSNLGGRFTAYSAGSHPNGFIDPTVFNLLTKANYPTGGLRSKSWDEFTQPDAPRLDFVFTVCDTLANEVCPRWPGQPMTAHWGVPDPAAFEGSEVEKIAYCAEIMRMLHNRINIFCALPIRSLNNLSLQKQLDDIGQVPSAGKSA